MKTCSTCKHWTELEEFKSGICEKIDDGDAESEELAVMESVCYTVLYCKPTFGCVLHEDNV